jgi:esterase/lipase superfamily enzyme
LKFDGAPFLYSWPSRGGVSSYTYDRASAEQSEPYLRQFAEMVVKESGARSVSVIAHSMGNQLVLRVLKDLKAISTDVAINQIILAAPDVDRDSFENIARDLKGMARGITLYAAGNDRALGISRNFHGGVPRAGDVPPSGPVVVEGVDTIDVTAISTDTLALNHSSYAEKNTLLDDIARLLQTGERPPDKRLPALARVPGPRGEYWRYP